MGHYEFSPVGAQMGCDFEPCPHTAVGYVEVRLKHQSHGGVREKLYLAVCAEHTKLGTPVERRWVPDEGDLP